MFLRHRTLFDRSVDLYFLNCVSRWSEINRSFERTVTQYGKIGRSAVELMGWAQMKSFSIGALTRPVDQ